MVVTALVISGTLTLFKKHLFMETVRASYFSSLATLSVFSIISLFFRAPTSLLTFLIGVVSIAVILKIRQKWSVKDIALAIGRYSIPVSIIAHFYFFLYGERMKYQDAIIAIVGDGWGFYFLTLALTLGLTYFFYNYIFTKGLGGAKYKRYDPAREAHLQQRGNEGELYVNQVLDRAGFKYIHDLLLFKKGRKKIDDKATQLDQVAFVDENEIWVIETKNWRGTIELNLEQYDCKVTYPDGRTQTMYNPVLQNQMHVDVVRGLLEREYGKRKFNRDYKIMNVIVFIDQKFDYEEDDLIILGSDAFKNYLESGAVTSKPENFREIYEILQANDYKNDPRANAAHERIISSHRRR